MSNIVKVILVVSVVFIVFGISGFFVFKLANKPYTCRNFTINGETAKCGIVKETNFDTLQNGYSMIRHMIVSRVTNVGEVNKDLNIINLSVVIGSGTSQYLYDVGVPVIKFKNDYVLMVEKRKSGSLEVSEFVADAKTVEQWRKLIGEGIEVLLLVDEVFINDETVFNNWSDKDKYFSKSKLTCMAETDNLLTRLKLGQAQKIYDQIGCLPYVSQIQVL